LRGRTAGDRIGRTSATWPLAGAAEALKALLSRQATGKLVLLVDERSGG